MLKPDSGKITVFGLPPEKASHRIGYVPQYVHFDPKFPVDVMDVVLMGRLKRGSWGFYRAGDRAAASDALGTVGMRELASRPFSDLSGGQRQRVLIARALTANQELLLLDEPTSNIDRSAEREIEHLIRDLGKSRTILIVSHDLGVVSTITSRVLCVNGSVEEHHTSNLSGEMIGRLYSSEVSLVDHAGCCDEGENHG